MGTDLVLGCTLERAVAAGLTVGLLPPLRDLDRVEDLQAALAVGPPPSRLGAFTSPVHHPRVAAILGISLGVTFLVCFVTGLLSDQIQQPRAWFYWPAEPRDLYRWTQGGHVVSGVAAIPLLLAKLWTVHPKLWRWPPASSSSTRPSGWR